MIFSLVIAVLVLGIAYFHWVQGLLSGIISMVLAILAALLAVGYHESIVVGVLGGKMAGSANGIMLCVIFAIVYGIGRIVFDSFIPGNVRLPLYLDQIGGGLCGVVVGIFATGMFALAMQSMPFGPSIMGHSLYALAEDKEVTVEGARRQESAMVVGALEMEGGQVAPDESKEQKLWVSSDTMVADFVAFQSDSGALAGGTKLRDRHPNLVRELFFQRLGMESGAKRVAMNIGGRKEIEVASLFAPTATLLQMDGENPSLQRGRNLPKTVKPDPNSVTLIIRTTIARTAADTDGRFRFSLGAVRLVANGKDITPTGVLYGAGRYNMLMNYRVDDFLVATLDKDTNTATIDLVFIAPRADVLADPAAKDGLTLRKDAFLEVKRLARVDLAEKAVAASMPPAAPAGGMTFKKETITEREKRLSEAGLAPVAQ